MEKTSDLPEIIDKLNRIILYRVHPSMNGIRTSYTSDDRH